MKPSVTKPRVVFFTQSCFSHCDISLIPHLLDDYEIIWYVFYPRDEQYGYQENDILKFGKNYSVCVHPIRLKNRLRSILSAFELFRINREIKSNRPSLLYINAYGFPWLGMIVGLFNEKKRLLWAIHDVENHNNKRVLQIDYLYKKIIYYSLKNFHFLSESQMNIFNKNNKYVNTFLAPHLLLNYGKATAVPPVEKIRFLFFGRIEYYKGIDLLIQAAEILWKEGRQDFEVVIAGKPDGKVRVEELINHHEIFQLELRTIPNEKIPDLFSSSHYLVLPYRDVTQSGPLALALEYGVPIIHSDLPGFMDLLDECTIDFPFISNDPHDLSRVLKRVLNITIEEWISNKKKIQDYVIRKKQKAEDIMKYKNMFSSIINGN